MNPRRRCGPPRLATPQCAFQGEAAIKRETGVETYLKEVNKVPLLTPEEEKDLVRRLREGDRAAREHIVKANLRLVVSLARKYVNRGLSLSDLIEEGNVGLLQALEKFDPAKECRFATYATWWVRQAIRRAIVNTAKTVRIPSHMVEMISKWKAASTELSQRLGRSPFLNEVADAINLTPQALTMMRRALSTQQSSAAQLSLDAMLASGGAESESALGIVPENSMNEMDRKWLRTLLTTIDEREAQVLRLRYGLEDGEGKTLHEVGEKLGVSRERVRQIEKDALGRMYLMIIEAGNTSRRYRRGPNGEMIEDTPGPVPRKGRKRAAAAAAAAAAAVEPSGPNGSKPPKATDAPGPASAPMPAGRDAEPPTRAHEAGAATRRRRKGAKAAKPPEAGGAGG